MANSTIWWLSAGVAVAIELLTGTFYLLMVAVGLAAAAVATHMGAGSVAQLVTAALVGGGAVFGWHIRQGRRPSAPAATLNRDVNLDIGETVHVDEWGPDGTATVKYRGANWTVLHQSGNAQSSGPHRVVEVLGSRLIVVKV